MLAVFAVSYQTLVFKEYQQHADNILCLCVCVCVSLFTGRRPCVACGWTDKDFFTAATNTDIFRLKPLIDDVLIHLLNHVREEKKNNNYILLAGWKHIGMSILKGC